MTFQPALPQQLCKIQLHGPNAKFSNGTNDRDLNAWILSLINSSVYYQNHILPMKFFKNNQQTFEYYFRAKYFNEKKLQKPEFDTEMVFLFSAARMTSYMLVARVWKVCIVQPRYQACNFH
jgi:hypothetical protein